MNSLLNIIFAWGSLLMIIFLCALFPISRLLENEKYKSNQRLLRWQYILKSLHKPLGIIVILIMFMHGRMSGQRPGIEAILILLISILLGLSYLLNKKYPNGWKLIHRSLSLLLISLIFIHIFNAVI